MSSTLHNWREPIYKRWFTTTDNTVIVWWFPEMILFIWWRDKFQAIFCRHWISLVKSKLRVNQSISIEEIIVHLNGVDVCFCWLIIIDLMIWWKTKTKAFNVVYKLLIILAIRLDYATLLFVCFRGKQFSCAIICLSQRRIWFVSEWLQHSVISSYLKTASGWWLWSYSIWLELLMDLSPW